jgi:hypothetical protein
MAPGNCSPPAAASVGRRSDVAATVGTETSDNVVATDYKVITEADTSNIRCDAGATTADAQPTESGDNVAAADHEVITGAHTFNVRCDARAATTDAHPVSSMFTATIKSSLTVSTMKDSATMETPKEVQK